MICDNQIDWSKIEIDKVLKIIKKKLKISKHFFGWLRKSSSKDKADLKIIRILTYPLKGDQLD